MGKSKYNTSFKYLTVQLGYLKNVQDTKKECYQEDKEIALNWQYGIVDNRQQGLRWFNYSQVGINNQPFKDCAIRIINNKKVRVSRANKKIEDIIIKNEIPVFITLTFNDDILKTTTQQTRRRYVSRFLKEHCNTYVANIDYSPDKGREHYHAVINEKIAFDDWLKYGFVFAEKIRKHTTPRKISNYINKLTLHAFKVENTPRLIYSRN